MDKRLKLKQRSKISNVNFLDQNNLKNNHIRPNFIILFFNLLRFFDIEMKNKTPY
jgi:hypothetical protein